MSTVTTLIAGMYSMWYRVYSSEFTSAIVFLVINLLIMIITTMGLKICFNGKKYLETLLNLLQMPFQNSDCHFRTKTSKVTIMLYTLSFILLCYRCFYLLKKLVDEKVCTLLKLDHISTTTLFTKVLLYKIFVLKLNSVIAENFNSIVKKLHKVLIQATSENRDMSIITFEIKLLLKRQKDQRDAIYRLCKLFEIPMLLLILENCIFCILKPGELVTFIRWIDDWNLEDIIFQFLELMCYFLWVVMTIEPFHRISTLDDEMNYLLNDFLARCLEEGVVFDGSLELERTIEHRCAFPLAFNLLGILKVNRGIIANMLGATVTYSILLIQYYKGLS